MNHCLDNTWQHLQLGETLIASGVDGLVHGWQASTDALGKLRPGAERWQTAIRQMQASTVNFADILRARSFL